MILLSFVIHSHSKEIDLSDLSRVLRLSLSTLRMIASLRVHPFSSLSGSVYQVRPAISGWVLASGCEKFGEVALWALWVRLVSSLYEVSLWVLPYDFALKSSFTFSASYHHKFYHFYCFDCKLSGKSCGKSCGTSKEFSANFQWLLVTRFGNHSW